MLYAEILLRHRALQLNLPTMATLGEKKMVIAEKDLLCGGWV